MLWLIPILIAAFFYAFNMFVDNYMTDTWFRRKDQDSSVIEAFFRPLSAILQIAVMVILFGGFHVFLEANIPEIAILLIAGTANVIAGLFYYRALQADDATGIAILYQFFPVVSLLLAFLILGDNMSWTQILAFFIILFAALILVFGKKKREQKLTFRAIALMFGASIGWALGDVLFILALNRSDTGSFEGAYVWFQVGAIVSIALSLVLRKKWRQSAKRFIKEQRAKKLAIVSASAVNHTIAAILYRFALTLGFVAIISITLSVTQLILTFVLGLILSLLWPKFGREKLTKKAILRHLFAVVFMVAGILLLG